jgi:hypothetical protein
VIDHHTAFPHQFFNVTIAQHIAQIPPPFLQQNRGSRASFHCKLQQLAIDLVTASFYSARKSNPRRFVHFECKGCLHRALLSEHYVDGTTNSLTLRACLFRRRPLGVGATHVTALFFNSPEALAALYSVFASVIICSIVLLSCKTESIASFRFTSTSSDFCFNSMANAFI